MNQPQTQDNEVARLRELLNRAIEVAEDLKKSPTSHRWCTCATCKKLDSLHGEARLAPAPEEPATEDSSVVEPVPSWRELGPDEVIQMDDMYRSGVSSRNYPVTSVMIGKPVGNFPGYSFRTRRHLPKQEGEQPCCSLGTPLAFDIEEIEAVANHPFAPRVDFYTRQLAMRSAHAIRYLRDEIQKLKEAKP